MKYVVIDCAENIYQIGTYKECLAEVMSSPELSLKYELRIEKASKHGI